MNVTNLLSSQTQEQQIIMKMVTNTKRPKSVQATAIEFHKIYMHSKNYLSIHWRYDEADFGWHCERASSGLKACAELLDGGFRPVKVAYKIDEIIRSRKLEVDTIHFAAPPSMNKFVVELREFVRNYGYSFFCQYDIVSFIERKYKNCEKTKMGKQKHDFVSQVEQEIAMKSRVFMFSDGSSWSETVQAERTTRLKAMSDMDNNILF